MFWLFLKLSQADGRVYKVGYPPHPWLKPLYSPTFETYLSEEAGKYLNPPRNVTFEFVEYADEGALGSLGIDFLFADSKAVACYEMRYARAPMLTLNQLQNGIAVDQWGGVFYTSANNTDIFEIEDLRDKTLAFHSFVGFGGFQIPWKELRDRGYYLFSDSKMIQMGGTTEQNVANVLAGRTDAAITFTSKLESMAAGGFDLSQLRILNLKHTTSDGEHFPYLLSTATYPGDALTFTGKAEDSDIAQAVCNALMAIDSAHPVAIAGGYSHFVHSLSYWGVQKLQLSLSQVSTQPGTGNVICKDSSKGDYSVVTCPAGYFKTLESESIRRCFDLGYDCPEQLTCYCDVCLKGDQIEIRNNSHSVFGEACKKMRICTTVEQQETFRMKVRDNNLSNLSIEYRFHRSTGIQTGVPIQSEFDNHEGEIVLSSNEKGTFLLEVFADGKQIPSSPVMIKVLERTCGENEAATVQGDCEMVINYVYYPFWLRILTVLLGTVGGALSIVFAVWTIWNRKTRLVLAAQPAFLYLICTGCLISFITIFTVAIDENSSLNSEKFLDFNCNLGIWLYGIGFSLTVSALHAKTFRAKKLMVDNRPGAHVSTSIVPYLTIVAMSLFIEALCLGMWSTIAPLWFERDCMHGGQEFSESVGRCEGDTSSLFFAVILLLIHFVHLMHLLYMCYKVRYVPQEFAEHKWITASAVSSIEILLIAPLLVALTWGYSVTTAVVLVLALFLNGMSVLLMVFVPKVQMLHFQKYNDEDLNHEDALFNLRREVRNIVGPTRNLTFKDLMEANERNQEATAMLKKENERLRGIIETLQPKIKQNTESDIKRNSYRKSTENGSIENESYESPVYKCKKSCDRVQCADLKLPPRTSSESQGSNTGNLGRGEGAEGKEIVVEDVKCVLGEKK